MVFNPEKMPTLPSETPEDAEKRTAGKMAGKRGEGFGEIATGPEITEEKKEVQTENIKEKSVEAKREAQLSIMRDWAEREGLREGIDFKIISSITESVEEKDTTAPHEINRLYLAFRRDHFGKFTAFFEKIYPSEMRERNVRRPWSSEVTLNYSWGGRYCVAGESGLAIDSAPVESVDPPLCRPEHNRFKSFFQEKYGLELPSAEELDKIMIKMSEFLPWYEETLSKLKTAQKASIKPWEYQHPIDQLEYAVIILRDANILRQLKEKPGSLEGPGDYKDVQETRKSLTDRHRLEELPEEFSYIRDKIRHYNDLTYNADDWVDLEIIKKLLGDKYELPEEKGSRIDRIYEDYYSFDRKNFEIACREFSEAIFSSQAEGAERGREQTIEAVEENIEKYRQKELTLGNLQPDTEYNIELERHGFLFGSEFNDLILLSKEEADNARGEMLLRYPEYADRIKRYFQELNDGYTRSYLETFEKYFNGATVNLSWRVMDKEGQIDYTRTDKIFSFIRERLGILERLKGHEIFWNERGHLPPHLINASKEQIKQELFNKRLKILRRYPEVREWTLLNEPLQKETKFEDDADVHAVVFDPDKDIDFFVELFKRAKAINPDTKLYINECNILNGGEKTDRYKKLIQDLINNGAPIDGIGVQGHIFSSRRFVTPEIASESLDSLSELGLPIQITEFDVSNEVIAEYYKISDKEEAEKKRAEYVKQMLSLFFGKTYINGVYLWGFQDKTMWRSTEFGEKVGLFDEDFNLNEVGGAFFNKINKDWKTEIKIKSDKDGNLQFRGFPGNYKVTDLESGESKNVELL